jgi:hypothetical protein
LACELVPLPGHSGVAVRDDAGRWLVHAGDGYMYHGEVKQSPPLSHPVFAPIQHGAQTDVEARVATLERLYALRRGHGAWELARFTTLPGAV